MNRLALIVHVLTLCLWAGVLTGVSIAAATIFPTAKKLEATSTIFPQGTADQWRLVAGRIANQVFLVADSVQLVLCGAAILTIVILGVRKALKPGSALVIWLMALAGAVMTLAYHLLVLQPRMAQNLSGYWQNAAAGQTALADQFRAAFNDDHPTASTVLVTITILVLVAGGAALWSGIGGKMISRDAA